MTDVAKVAADCRATGDRLGLALPVDAAALRESGAEWLTRAFHAMGSLPAGNRVVEITRCEGFAGGGTGTKALLSVRYAQPGEGLEQDLFVKISRNFADPEMDRTRFHLGATRRHGSHKEPDEWGARVIQVGVLH